uniref:VTC domain-containing protein n=1 Tax=Toxoplasma gondii (strain ATCC 50861 / VEG) TaxID=432359 RepID=A0A0F7UQU0_TOXGV|nr:TPA: VTC domain-containing protein [Toxoplasma gondii VEG]
MASENCTSPEASPYGLRRTEKEERKRDARGSSVGSLASLPSCAESALPRHYLPLYVNIPQMEKLITQLAADASQKLSTATIKKQLKQMQQEPLTTVPLNENSGKKETVSGDRSGLAKAAERPPVSPSWRATAEESVGSQESGQARERDDREATEREERDEAQKTTQTAGTSIFGQAELMSLLPESRFRNLMQHQVQRLNFFVQSKEQEVCQRLSHIYSAIGLMREQHGFTVDVAARLEEELDAQSAEITHLDFFVRRNYKALTDATRWFIFSLIKEKFCDVDLEGLMLRLSLAWSAFRQAKAGVTESGKWEAPETFVRNTTKYWLRSDRVVHAQCLILKHLPFLVYGASEEDIAAALLRQQNLQKSEGGADEEAEEAELAGNSATSAASLKRKIGATQPITSVYVDSNTGYCFENRILRMEGAELIRFRWYGVNDNEGDKPVFVERKTHHESWTGLSSTKERFTLDQKFVKSYLLGRLPAAEALGIQFRERWWRDKKKEEEAKEREEREREGEAEAKEKTERNGRQEDGEACQDSEEGERERERAMEPREEATSREGCRENVGVGAEDERCRARKETTTEQRRQWEREEEEAETKYFQDAKTQKSLQLACEIQNTLLRHSLLPMVRTSYLRAAFQLSTSNAVRISLDTNLCMVDELTPQYVSLGMAEERRKLEPTSEGISSVGRCPLWENLRRPHPAMQQPVASPSAAFASASSRNGCVGATRGPAEEREKHGSPAHAVKEDLVRFERMREDDDDVLWCRVAEELLGKNDVVRFPFAVLEVKLQTSPSPPWVQELLALCDAIMVPKFSKFQHGMAFLHSDKISRLPYWLQASPEATGLRRDGKPLGRAASLDAPAQEGQSAPPRERRERPEPSTLPAASLPAPPHAEGVAEPSSWRVDGRAERHTFFFGSRRGKLFYSPVVRSVEEGQADDEGASQVPQLRVAGERGPPRHSVLTEPRNRSSANEQTLNCVSVDQLPAEPGLAEVTRRRRPRGKSTLGTDAARTLDWLRQRHTEALAEDFPTHWETAAAAEARGFLASRDNAFSNSFDETQEHLALAPLPRSEAPLQRSHDEEDDGWLSDPQSKQACLRKVMRQSKKMRKLDPKSFFANERTFLQYLQKAVYLGSLAITLLQWGGGGVVPDVAGFCLAFGVLALLVYSYRVFEERGSKLERKVARGDMNAGERYDSVYGPVAIFATVSVIVLFILCLQIDAGVKKLKSV